MYAAQTAYEAIREYFSRPGAVLARTYNGVGRIEKCDYRGENGTKCAVGCLIPDTIYDVAIEGLSAGEALWRLYDHNIDQFEETFGDPNTEEYANLVAFLESAQTEHDDTATEDAADFVARLDVLAGRWNLAVVV